MEPSKPSTLTPIPRKPQRKPNWTADESFLLVELIEEKIKIIKGKLSNQLTMKDKKRAWVDIAEGINEEFPNVMRTAVDCEKRWFFVQSKAKSYSPANDKQSTETGADGPTASHAPLMDKVQQLIGETNATKLGKPSMNPALQEASCVKWLNVIKAQHLPGKTMEQLHESHRLCSDHFSSENYTTGMSNSRLLKNACPDQNIPVNNKSLSIDYVADPKSSINVNKTYGEDDLSFGSVSTLLDEVASEVQVPDSPSLKQNNAKNACENKETSEPHKLLRKYGRSSRRLRNKAQLLKTNHCHNAQYDGGTAGNLNTSNQSASGITTPLRIPLPKRGLDKVPVDDPSKRVCAEQTVDPSDKMQSEGGGVDSLHDPKQYAMCTLPASSTTSQPNTRHRKRCLDEISVDDPSKQVPTEHTNAAHKQLGVSSSGSSVSPSVVEETQGVPVKEENSHCENLPRSLAKQKEKQLESDSITKEIHKEMCTCMTSGKTSSEKGKLSAEEDVRNRTEQRFKCNICLKEFSSNAQLIRHQNKHFSRQYYRCQFCGKTFRCLNSVEKHLMDQMCGEEFPCHICGKTYKVKLCLVKHIKKYHEKPVVRNASSKATLRKANISDSPIRLDKKVIKCAICCKAFSCKLNLSIHMAVHTKKWLRCSVCNEEFEDVSDLNRHKKMHHKKETFECNVCRKEFSHILSLSKHMTVHTGDERQSDNALPRGSDASSNSVASERMNDSREGESDIFVTDGLLKIKREVEEDFTASSMADDYAMLDYIKTEHKDVDTEYFLWEEEEVAEKQAIKKDVVLKDEESDFVKK